jgi:two-component system, LytTR family, response regulator
MAQQYKCLIVDDEAPAHLVLSTHIKNTEELILTGNAYSAKEALQLLTSNEYDIVFMDIEMPLINGLEIIKMTAHKAAFILVTAYNNFAFEAYQLDAIDYMQKPVTYARFLKAIEKAIAFCNATKKEITQNWTIKVDGAFTTIIPQNISHIEGLGNYIKIYFVDNTKYILTNNTLKNALEALPASLFIQAHKSFIINTNCIAAKNKDYVTLNNTIQIPIGRRYELAISQL